MDLKISQWNNSYDDGGNHLWYPREEVIRFISKYIRKKTGINSFEQIRDYKTGLDLGCGMGRHVKYLDEMEFDAYGIDLSEVAISKGKEWFKHINREYLCEKIVVGSILELPYDEQQFDFVISNGVIDSMEFDIAFKGMEQVYKVLNNNGLFYFNVIMSPENKVYEETIQARHEFGTIQSFFDIDKVKEMLKNKFNILEYQIHTICNEDGKIINRRAHFVCEKIL